MAHAKPSWRQATAQHGDRDARAGFGPFALSLTIWPLRRGRPHQALFFALAFSVAPARRRIAGRSPRCASRPPPSSIQNLGAWYRYTATSAERHAASTPETRRIER